MVEAVRGRAATADAAVRFAGKDRSAASRVSLLVFAAILAHVPRHRCQLDRRVIAATVPHVVGRSSGASCVSTCMADPPNDDPSLPRPSLPDIQRALAEQYTDNIRHRAERFAKKRAWMVGRAGIPIPALKKYAEELAHDAMASVWLGTRNWDPARPLLPRLCWIIKDRTWRETKRAQRHQHVSFDLAANDAEVIDHADAPDDEPMLRTRSANDLGHDVETALASASFGDCAPIMLATLARKVVDALQQLAQRDATVRAILDAWELGFIERDEVVLVTCLTKRAYDAGRKRIRRLAKRLPPDLREAVDDILRRAS